MDSWPVPELSTPASQPPPAAIARAFSEPRGRVGVKAAKPANIRAPFLAWRCGAAWLGSWECSCTSDPRNYHRFRGRCHDLHEVCCQWSESMVHWGGPWLYALLLAIPSRSAHDAFERRIRHLVWSRHRCVLLHRSVTSSQARSSILHLCLCGTHACMVACSMPLRSPPSLPGLFLHQPRDS